MLTYQQIATLRRRGVIVAIEYSDGSAKCHTRTGDRTFTRRDLQEMSKRSCMDGTTAWIGGTAQ